MDMSGCNHSQRSALYEFLNGDDTRRWKAVFLSIIIGTLVGFVLLAADWSIAGTCVAMGLTVPFVFVIYSFSLLKPDSVPVFPAALRDPWAVLSGALIGAGAMLIFIAGVTRVLMIKNMVNSADYTNFPDYVDGSHPVELGFGFLLLVIALRTIRRG